MGIKEPNVINDEPNVIREEVRKSQRKQAEKMLERSKKYLHPIEHGDYVTLKIPDVDKSLSSASNLICRVIDICWETSLYELVSEAGVLNTMFAHNAFDKLNTKDFPLIEFDLSKQVSVRQAANQVDIGGGQGMVKCNCTGTCANKTCGCRKSNVLCNSRCHGKNNKCSNK